MKRIITTVLLIVTTFSAYAQDKIRTEKIKGLSKEMTAMSKFEFHEMQKYNFNHNREYPDRALLFRQGKILLAEQLNGPDLPNSRSFPLEGKQKEFTAIYKNDPHTTLNRSSIQMFGSKRYLLFYYQQYGDQFITYFSEPDANGKYFYGNLQFQEADRKSAEDLINRLLSN